jgi:putative transposase
MKSRRPLESIVIPEKFKDITTWPSVLIDNLCPEDRNVYTLRKKAVDMYVATNTTVKDILLLTGLDGKNFRRLVKRCLDLDPEGFIWGYRALIPRKRLGNYTRTEKLSGYSSMTGGFNFLLEKHPTLQTLIEKLYLRKDKRSIQEPVIKIKHIHKKFLDECKRIGITIHEYPFNTKNLGKRSLERYVIKLETKHFNSATRRYGEKASQLASSTGIPSDYYLNITRPLERVQFDGHKIDGIFTIKFITPEGDEIVEVMDRIWILVIIDVATRAVLGHHLSLNKEYSASDVLHCIRNAIVPRARKQLSIPGLNYDPDGGFVGEVIQELQWALWDEFLYDNGKANLAEIVGERLTQVVGCSVNAGPVSLPVRRAYIERFFGTLEENGFHRLPNTTGSNPGDARRQEPSEQAIKYQISYDELDEITSVLISNYNGIRHEGINNLSPNEAMQQRVARGLLPRIMPEEQRGETQFLSMRVKRAIKGSIQEGRRPFIYYEGVEYRSDLLSRCQHLFGTTLDLLINMNDLIIIKAFLLDGSEFGSLTAMGKWGVTPHSLQMRKQINKLRNLKLLHYTSMDCPVEAYQKYLELKAVTHKSSRNNLAKVRSLRKQAEKEINGLPERITKAEDQSIETEHIERIPPKEANPFVRNPATNLRKYRTITY